MLPLECGVSIKEVLGWCLSLKFAAASTAFRYCSAGVPTRDPSANGKNARVPPLCHGLPAHGHGQDGHATSRGCPHLRSISEWQKRACPAAVAWASSPWTWPGWPCHKSRVVPPRRDALQDSNCTTTGFGVLAWFEWSAGPAQAGQDYAVPR